MFAGAILAAAAAAGAESPVAFLWLTPSGELTHVRSSAVLEGLDQRFDRETDLSLEPLDAAFVAECRGKLSCIVQAARPDYNRSVYLLANGTVAPYQEHREYVRESGIEVPQLMVILTGVDGPESDSLSGVLVDIDRALEFRHGLETMDRQAERDLRSEAVLGGTFRAEVTSPVQLDDVLDRLVFDQLRPVLQSLGHWRPYGTLVIRVPVVGAGIELDGELVGTTAERETVISEVRPGRHQVRLQHPSFVDYEASVQVERQQTATLEADLSPRPAQGSKVFRDTLLGSGLLVAAAGVGITIAGIVDADTSSQLACVDCGGARFRPFGAQDPEDPLTASEDSGPLAIPLGYSLALTGATWSVGTLLTPEEKAPWVPLLLGLAGGAAAYGISAAVNGGP